MQTNKKQIFKKIILKAGLSLGLIVITFLLFGLTNKAEAASDEAIVNIITDGDQG